MTILRAHAPCIRIQVAKLGPHVWVRPKKHMEMKVQGTKRKPEATYTSGQAALPLPKEAATVTLWLGTKTT